MSLWRRRAQARGRAPGRRTAFQTCYPRCAGPRRAGERAAESSFPAPAWKAGPCSRVCSWQPDARGPAATSSRGGDVCAPGARAATEPRLCRRGARPARRPTPSRPPHPYPPHPTTPGSGRAPALGGTLAGAPRAVSRTRGTPPAGGGAGETIICSVVMRRATAGRGSSSQACPLSRTLSLVPGPARTVRSCTATVKAGSCQRRARAHTRTHRGETFSKKNESLDSLLGGAGAARGLRG